MIPTWRSTWAIDDPLRVCYSCGAPPVSSFRDGSPKYDCPTGPHPPIYAATTPQTRYTATLTPEERQRAHDCAKLMQRNSKRKRDRWGVAFSFENHLLGAAGEIAFARLTGLTYRCKASNHSKPDVGPYQVRTTRHNPYLVIHENDADGTPVVAIMGDETTMQFRIVGWLEFAIHGKLPEFVRDPGNRRPAFFVPHALLDPPSTLPELRPKAAAEVFDDVPDDVLG
jgi:hypothetical protein